jgi:hypothetical protein
MINKDPGKRHFYLSMIKSLVRVAGGVALFASQIQIAAVLFICAEGLGIAEEF